MKTTIEIPDRLFKEIKKLAANRSVPMKVLIQEALEEMLVPSKKASESFKLRSGVFKGGALQPGVSLDNWTDIRSRIYEGRGE